MRKWRCWFSRQADASRSAASTRRSNGEKTKAPTPRSDAVGSRSPVISSSSESTVQTPRARPEWRCAGGRKPPMPSILVAAQYHLLVTVHVFEDLSRAEHHAGQRVVGDPD